MHRVTASSTRQNGLNSFIEISHQNLEKIILNLKSLGVKFVSLAQLEQAVFEDAGNQPVVHISFDDGYSDNYYFAFPILKRYNINFSIFVVSDFINQPAPFLWWYLIENIIENEQPVAFEKYDFSITRQTYLISPKQKIFEDFRILLLENADNDSFYFKTRLLKYAQLERPGLIPEMLNWSQIGEMLDSGLCEVGVHTKTHPRFSNLTMKQKMEEIRACKDEIKKHTGVEATSFSYPYGSPADIGPVDTMDEIMEACGIRLAFTTQSDELNKRINRYLIPREFLNNSATAYTLKTRLTGAYQRSVAASKI